MGRGLFATEPAFRAMINACDEAVRSETGWSLVEELHAGEASTRVEVVQPVLFAMEVALAAVWRSHGVEPDAVVGHSMGEVAAAYFAGALTLEDAVRVVCRRSELLARVAGKGAMALVELPLDRAERAVAAFAGRISVAAANGPRSTVVSGDPGAVDALLETLAGENVFGKRVNVDVASHSGQMDGLRGELMDTLAGVAPQHARLPIWSTVTGSRQEGSGLGAAYWARNLREPVLFAPAVRGLLNGGHTLFVEVAPHPILLPAIEEEIAAGEHDGVVVASSRRDQDERRVLLKSLATLYVRGCPVDWEKHHSAGGRCVPLPVYPWQRERYWPDVPLAAEPETGGHPLLGPPVSVASRQGNEIRQRALAATSPAYLADHRVENEVVLPGAAFLEAALAAAADGYGAAPHRLAEVAFERMAVLKPGASRLVQLVLERTGDRTVLPGVRAE
jgi:acyl transferase domain-containing protein